MTFYDNHGNPIAYLDDEIHFFLYTGEPVAYIVGDAVYSFSGKQLGWFEEGWIIDLQGLRVFFSDASHGGPMRPLRKIKPLRALKQLKPLKSLRELRKSKKIKSLLWSTLSSKSFFYQ